MNRTQRESSDQLLAGSVNREEHTFHRAAQAACEAPARPPPARTPAARLTAREVQALRTARLPLRQRPRPRTQALPLDQHARSTSANRLCPERRVQQSHRVPRQLPQRARGTQRDLCDQHRAPAPPRGNRLNGSSRRGTRLHQSRRHSRRHGRILSCCRRDSACSARGRRS
jgi:hypothetical protein